MDFAASFPKLIPALIPEPASLPKCNARSAANIKLTPGIAASIAVAYQEGGQALALEKIRETRQQIADAIALQETKSSKK